MSDEIRPLMALMSYGGISPATLNCALQDMPADPDMQWRIRPSGGDAAIDRARSYAASWFLLHSDANVLVMVDHDIEWSRGDAARIARKAYETRGVVAALVSKKAVGEGCGSQFGTDEQYEFGTDRIVELGPEGYCGGAFTAIHRDVLGCLAEQLPLCGGGFWPFFLPLVKPINEDEHLYLSEDWAFCERVKLMTGAKLYIDLRPVVVHHGAAGYLAPDAYTHDKRTY